MAVKRDNIHLNSQLENGVDKEMRDISGQNAMNNGHYMKCIIYQEIDQKRMRTETQLARNPQYGE